MIGVCNKSVCQLGKNGHLNNIEFFNPWSWYSSPLIYIFVYSLTLKKIKTVYSEIFVVVYTSKEKETQVSLQFVMIFICGEFSFCFKPEVYLWDNVEIYRVTKQFLYLMWNLGWEYFKDIDQQDPELEDLKFPCWMSFRVFVDHLYVFFAEMSVEISHPLFG